VKSLRRALSTGLALGVALSVVRSADAQMSVATGLSGVVNRTGADLWRSATRTDPLIRIDGRWTQLNGSADVWAGSDGLQLQHGVFDLLASPEPFGPLRFTATARMERSATTPLFARTVGTIESAMSLRVANGGGWLGVAAERARGMDSVGVQPLLRAGVWQRFGMMTLALSAESHRARLGGRPASAHEVVFRADSARDSLTGSWIHFPERIVTVGDSGAPSRPWLWSDLQARIAWTANRFSLDGRVGLQPKIATNPRSLWARAAATMVLAPRLALVASGGMQPSSVWLGTPSSRFLSVGLRVAPASLVRPAPPPFVRPSASSFTIRREVGDSANASFVVAIRVPDARAVELSGDFNGWKAVALHESQPGLWETTLTLAPGTHRLNMRVNGDTWVAPPGLPTTDDDFNGTVGLIVVT
jgi:hypothetical protein